MRLSDSSVFFPCKLQEYPFNCNAIDSLFNNFERASMHPSGVTVMLGKGLKPSLVN